MEIRPFFQIENTKIPFYKAKHFNSCLIFVTTDGACVKRLNTRKCIWISIFSDKFLDFKSVSEILDFNFQSGNIWKYSDKFLDFKSVCEILDFPR